MKTIINKSKLMKRAWTIYYNSINTTTWTYNLTFAESLKRAWMLEKKEVEARANLAAGIKPKYESVPFYAGAYDYYHGAGSAGRYFGD